MESQTPKRSGRVVLVLFLLVAGASLGYAFSVYTAPTYNPLISNSTYFYDPATSPHLANVIMPPERSILFQMSTNGAVSIGSILVYNGSIYYRYDWPCAPSQLCNSAPYPSRYFVFAGTSTTPNIQWNAGSGPYYPLNVPGGGWQTPLAYSWQPGRLYTFFIEYTNNTVTPVEVYNAPATSNGTYCADYYCSPLDPAYRIASYMIAGAIVLLAIGLLVLGRYHRWQTTRPKQTTMQQFQNTN